MSYRFVLQREDYSEFASGKVFYNLPGHPAFPVRLIREVFLRCLEIRRKNGLTDPVRLYDPCCGGAYHLAVLAFFHWESIDQLLASDIDRDSLSIAGRNLSLLTMEGMERRIQEIQWMISQYGKESHLDALKGALALKRNLEENITRHAIRTHLFQADALRAEGIRGSFGEKKADLVISDIPYGLKSSWQTSNPSAGQDEPITQLLETLTQVISSQAVVAVAATKQNRVHHPGYLQVEKLKLGFRMVTFLKLRAG